MLFDPLVGFKIASLPLRIAMPMPFQDNCSPFRTYSGYQPTDISRMTLNTLLTLPNALGLFALVNLITSCCSA